MTNDLISASDLLNGLKDYARKVERGIEVDKSKDLFKIKSKFAALLENRTEEEIQAFSEYLRNVLEATDPVRWGDTPFRILLERFSSKSVLDVDVIPFVKEYEIYAALGLILCEEGTQLLNNVDTAGEFQQRYDALMPQLREADNFAHKLHGYWFVLNAASENINQIYDHAKELAEKNAAKIHASDAGKQGHLRHEDAKKQVISRFIEGQKHLNNEKFGEWKSISAAAKAITLEMNFKENVLKSSNAERKIREWISSFLRLKMADS